MEIQLIQLVTNVGLGVVLSVVFGLFLKQIVSNLLAEQAKDRALLVNLVQENARSGAQIVEALRHNTQVIQDLTGVIREQSQRLDDLADQQKRHRYEVK